MPANAPRKGMDTGKKKGARRHQQPEELTGKPALAAAMVAAHEQKLQSGVLARSSPGWHLQREPAEFIGLMLIAGFLGGILLRFKMVRKAIHLYTALHRP